MIRIVERVRRLSGAPGLVLGLAAGVILGATQAPLSLWPLFFVGLPLLLALLDGRSGARGGFLLGWVAGVGYFGATMFWITEPFQVDAARTGWMAPFALAAMAGGLALFWAIPFAVARAFWPPGARRVLVLAGLWMLFEFARGHVLTGFPWGLVAYGWIGTPVSQSLALGGPYLLSLATLVAGLLPGLGRWWAVTVAAMMLALGWGHGLLRLAAPVPPRPEPVLVRLVQPDADQAQKWLPGMEEEFFQRHLDLSRSRTDPMPDVTIWAETAVAFLLDRDYLTQARAVASVGTEGHLILGIRRVDESSGIRLWYNSLAVLAPDGSARAVYDKSRLVPFGEYMPMAATIARLGLPGLTTLTGGGFSPGPGPRLLSVPGVPPFLPLICYEAIFPAAARAPEGRADWMIQITNDGWFGRISGPYQHFAQARARAIEQGLPLARVANTGISAMIDARGEVIASLGLGQLGALDAQLPGQMKQTPYSRTGDLPSIALILLFCLLTVSSFSSSNPTHGKR